jgi:hypothetical protein
MVDFPAVQTIGTSITRICLAARPAPEGWRGINKPRIFLAEEEREPATPCAQDRIQVNPRSEATRICEREYMAEEGERNLAGGASSRT